MHFNELVVSPPESPVSDASTSVLTELTKSEQWWFEDGNVILIAEDKLFCVHRGILAHHSIVFQDMFTFPQPERIEQIEGRPVVHLAETHTDLSILLSSLYEGYKYYRSEFTLTFAEVSAMLRLGSKYQVDHIREEAIHRLRICFPAKLQDFPARNVFLQDPDFQCTKGIYLRKKHAIGVVNLARAFDLDFLLPPAFYLCAQLGYEELLEGVPDDSGSGPSSSLMKLSPKDVMICLKGREALTRSDLRSLRPLFFPVVSTECKKPVGECIEVKRAIVQELWYENLANPNALVEPTDWLTQYASGRNNPLCQPCLDQLVAEYNEQRQFTWDFLGECFSVPNWPIP